MKYMKKKNVSFAGENVEKWFIGKLLGDLSSILKHDLISRPDYDDPEIIK